MCWCLIKSSPAAPIVGVLQGSGKLQISLDEAPCWNIQSYDIDCEDPGWLAASSQCTLNLHYEIYWADGNSSVQGIILIRSDNFCHMKCKRVKNHLATDSDVQLKVLKACSLRYSYKCKGSWIQTIYFFSMGRGTGVIYTGGEMVTPVSTFVWLSTGWWPLTSSQ